MNKERRFTSVIFFKLLLSLILFLSFFSVFKVEIFAANNNYYVCQSSSINPICVNSGTTCQRSYTAPSYMCGAGCGSGNRCMYFEFGYSAAQCNGWCGVSCVPSCPTQCGQSDGCGGTCGTSDQNVITNTWCDGACNSAPPACGNYQVTMTCWNQNKCGGVSQFEWNDSCGTSCNECGPSYGGWGACTAPTFTQSRTVSYSCQAATTQTQACVANISGIIFDATAVTDCTTIGTQPKLNGVTVTASSTVSQIGQSFNSTSNSTGNYAFANLKVPDTYALTFSGLPSGYDTTPKLSCDGGTTVALSTNGQAVTRRYGFTKIYDPWFQLVGGDLFASGGIKSHIPQTCTGSASCNNYTVGATTYTPLIVANANLAAGILAKGASGTTTDIGTATNAVVSQPNLRVSSGYTGRNFDYGYYYAKTAALNRANYSGTAKPSGSSNTDNTRQEFSSAAPGSIFALPSTYGVYLSSGTLTIDGSWSVGANEKIIILHNGNVNVTGNMTVSNTNAFFAVVASGTITFASNVTSAQGIYIGDTLTVASTGNTATEQKFNGQGTFIGWTAVNLLRNRGQSNATDSSEMFTFRPDLIYYAPDGFKPARVIWQELAP